MFALSDIAEPLEFLSFSLAYRFTPYLVTAVTVIALSLLFFNRKKLALVVFSSIFALLPFFSAVDILALQSTESVAYLSDGKNDLVFVEHKENRLAVVFSYSESFVKNEIQTGKLTSPSVKCDTLLLPDPSEQHTLLVYELWEQGLLRQIILPSQNPTADGIAVFSEKLGITVTRFTPNDTVVYNGIPIKTYGSENGRTYAFSVSLPTKTILYMRENAPNDFDIRFGALTEHYDILIRGAYGGEMMGSLIPDADEIWEYEPKGYVPSQDSYAFRYGNSAVRDKRK